MRANRRIASANVCFRVGMRCIALVIMGVHENKGSDFIQICTWVGDIPKYGLGYRWRLDDSRSLLLVSGLFLFSDRM